jgi:very-short-patch-repair endonuclease
MFVLGLVPKINGGGKSNTMTRRPVYNAIFLKARRKELRNNLTPAEAILWGMLKGGQLDNRKFRRQHSIGKYIVDFYCPAERLVIELDGAVHLNAGQNLYDSERDEFLNGLGIKVLRFENKMVFEDMAGVLREIAACFACDT